MARSVIAKVFLGGSALLLSGLVIGAASLAIGYAGAAFILDGREIVGMIVTPAGYVMAAVAAAAAVALVGGACAVLIGWVAALASMARASAKGWFWLLAVLGAATFGLGALAVYLLAHLDRVAPKVTSSSRGVTA